MAKAAPKKQFKVHFDPDNVDITVAGGANLLETAIAAGVHVYASCGGAGTCGTCKVQVKKGEVETTRTKKLSQAEYDQGIRQACQSRVTGDVSVYLPVESRLEKAVLTRESQRAAEALATGWRFKPPLGKCCLELTPPSLKDNASDLSRLLRGLKQQCGLSNLWVDFEVVRKLPGVLRDGKWKVTVTTLVTAAKPRGGEARRPRVINVAPGDTRDRHYALAFDIGTTTVCGQLLDLNRARVVAEGISLNGQISYGADVISRIAQSQKPGGLKRLQRAVVDTMNAVIGELLARGQVKTEHIGHVIAAGNTTMTQLLVGIDPKYIRLAPYVPAANFLPPVEASSRASRCAPRSTSSPSPRWPATWAGTSWPAWWGRASTSARS
ncbi:MAG: 2Fe-2S iron-sulfur cluster-binding protein [Chloroflexota bacterium]